MSTISIEVMSTTSREKGKSSPPLLRGRCNLGDSFSNGTKAVSTPSWCLPKLTYLKYFIFQILMVSVKI